jgi:hypothetical protein
MAQIVADGLLADEKIAMADSKGVLDVLQLRRGAAGSLRRDGE